MEPPIRNYTTRAGKAEYERQLLLYRQQGDYERALARYRSLSDKALLVNLAAQNKKRAAGTQTRFAEFNRSALYEEAVRRGLTAPTEPSNSGAAYWAAAEADRAAPATGLQQNVPPPAPVTNNSPQTSSTSSGLFSGLGVLGFAAIALAAYLLWRKYA